MGFQWSEAAWAGFPISSWTGRRDCLRPPAIRRRWRRRYVTSPPIPTCGLSWEAPDALTFASISLGSESWRSGRPATMRPGGPRLLLDEVLVKEIDPACFVRHRRDAPGRVERNAPDDSADRDEIELRVRHGVEHLHLTAVQGRDIQPAVRG